MAVVLRWTSTAQSESGGVDLKAENDSEVIPQLRHHSSITCKQIILV